MREPLLKVIAFGIWYLSRRRGATTAPLATRSVNVIS
jgi:hypothetical protein